MSYDIVKYERGQVWIIRHKYKNDAVGHEIQKDRPWLILSVGKFNRSSGMVTAVPISTRDHTKTVSQVHYYNEMGRSCVIMCEQIKTFDYSSGAYIFDYMGHLSDEILEKVDVALSVHLGMHYSPITLDKLYDSMEAIIKSVGYLQDKDKTPKFNNDDVLRFAEELKSHVVSTAFSEVATTKKNMNPYASPLDKLRGIPDPNEENEYTIEVVESTKTSRRKWTKETCEEFLSDTNTMTVQETMDKWNITKTTRYYSTKNYVKGILEKFNMEDLEKSPNI